MMYPGKPFTKAEIAEIRRRKLEGETYIKIAESLERNYDSMLVVLHHESKGRREGVREKHDARYNQALELLRKGTNISEIAKIQKRAKSGVCEAFDRRGITSEARQNIITNARRWNWLKTRTRESRTGREGARMI
ncbi:MAG: hypothetical protein AAB573_05065 [Patescibacteria group bacterium]